MKRERSSVRSPPCAAAALALLGAALIWQPAQAAAPPLLTISPKAGHGGTSVLVKGSGFVRNATGFVKFGPRRVATIRTNRHGRIATRFRTPSAAAGRVTVTVVVRVGRVRVPGTNRFRPRSLQRAARLFSLRTSSPPNPTPTGTSPSPPGPDQVVMAAGDLVSSATNQDAIAVRDVIKAQNPNQILMLGDYQYSYGSLSAILGGADKLYGPKPGGLWPLIKPTAGPTHDIKSCTENDYKAYWGVGGMQPYSFNLGSWHVISLPSAALRYGCNTAGILAWLQQDLAAHTSTCTLAFWHEPYWTRPTSTHSRDLAAKPWVQTIYDAGADVILSASQHNYQRFAPQSPSDQLDPARGLRQFVVGTGGAGLYGFTGSAAHVEASNATTHGALRLTLRSAGYDWSFLRAAGGSFTDSGSGTCH